MVLPPNQSLILGRKEDLIQKGLRPLHPLRGVSTPRVVGKKTSFRRDCDFHYFLNCCPCFHVGKKTSFRRDCDSTQRQFLASYLVGKKTSFRRDCDLSTTAIFSAVGVGKKTSFRRDCDWTEINHFILPCLQERRPHLEGIATLQPIFWSQARSFRRKEDLIQKGLRLFIKTVLVRDEVGKKTSFRRDCDF